MYKIKTQPEVQEERWKSIVQGIANGQTIKSFASENELSKRTVEAHISRAFLKYNAVSISHLVAIFFRNKLIK